MYEACTIFVRCVFFLDVSIMIQMDNENNYGDETKTCSLGLHNIIPVATNISRCAPFLYVRTYIHVCVCVSVCACVCARMCVYLRRYINTYI